ncbi:MAG: hypothetical protein M3Q48_12455 [Actinomycetota bacterium]|nr:hypothetical protein [Actinomycetota bacterium]
MRPAGTSTALRLFEPVPEASPASEWCQRWDGGHHSWRHRSEGGFDPSRYRVHALDEGRARAYVHTNHYSASYPAAQLRYGLFEGKTLAGVAVLGVPMHPKVLTNPFPDLVPCVESMELSRLVLADRVPANAESWFLAAVFAEAAAAGVRGVVAFADPVPRVLEGRLLFPGGIGIIYQASNAVFAGRSAPRTQTLLPTGEFLSDRAQAKVRNRERGHEYVERRLVALGARPPRGGEAQSGWLRQALEDVGAQLSRHLGCYRYLFAIGPGRRRRAALRARIAGPCPKNVA